MKFGKQIQAQQIPGWSQYYLDYKFLKKIVSSLSKSRPASEAAALAVGIRPEDLLKKQSPTTQPPLWPSEQIATPGSLTVEQTALFPTLSSANEDDRGAAFQAYKAAFFFKLERELEKINTFYLQKEAELKLRLETLLSKQKAAASRVIADATDDALASRDYVELKAVEEGFRLLERDLTKLQQFVDINATGFRKILKKWDKRSKSTTKELYLSRQVEVQPVFNRQLLADLSNTVTDCLVDITNVSVDQGFPRSTATDIMFTQQMSLERATHLTAFSDLENDLRKAISARDESAVSSLVRHAGSLLQQDSTTTTLVNRILWKAAIDAPPSLADIIMSGPDTSFDFQFIDDINGRSCLHEAAIAGAPRLVDLCLSKAIQADRVDAYGRTALHYAAMNGHAIICKRLLEAGIPPNTLDRDNYSPLIYAIIYGCVDCVNVLLAVARVSVSSKPEGTDLTPLSLACQFGRVEVAKLLINHGAKSLPNSNGEYPIHLAASEGHADVCKLLVGLEGCDVSDKYNEWTPLFHAASTGHDDCLRVLLEAGCKPHSRDETGRRADFYAAWNGHMGCVNAILNALARSPGAPLPTTAPLAISPLSDLDLSGDMDSDNIPSLSLPPPIIPFRVYGHNYLDKTTLIQITLGCHLSTRDINPNSAVEIVPRIMLGSSTLEQHHAAPSLKLVITSLPDKSNAHHAVSFPVKSRTMPTFAFQMQDTENLSLEFSVYPILGSKAIGRAVALPGIFNHITSRTAHTLPLLDYRLHVVGQISFEVSTITSFRGVTLEIGGAVETYWKSIQGPPPSIKPGHPSSHLPGSAHTSPSVYSPFLMAESGGMVFSSLQGQYVHAVIQATRDLQPVVFSRCTVRLNDEVELGIADLTLDQLLRIARREKFLLDPRDHRFKNATDWANVLGTHLIPLTNLLQVLPIELGVSLELAYPTPNIRQNPQLLRAHDLNTYVDTVLTTAYNALSDLPESVKFGHEPERRKLVFSSFSPDICAALNWKQPNYAVFFATDCGVWKWPGEVDVSSRVDEIDHRCQSVLAAIDFAKSNNFLGLLVNSFVLAKVPSLIPGIREAGLLLASFGNHEATDPLSIPLDAHMRNGILTFTDNSSRA